jgi:hypothetical protein
VADEYQYTHSHCTVVHVKLVLARLDCHDSTTTTIELFSCLYLTKTE